MDLISAISDKSHFLPFYILISPVTDLPWDKFNRLCPTELVWKSREELMQLDSFFGHVIYAELQKLHVHSESLKYIYIFYNFFFVAMFVMQTICTCLKETYISITIRLVNKSNFKEIWVNYLKQYVVIELDQLIQSCFTLLVQFQFVSSHNS